MEAKLTNLSAMEEELICNICFDPVNILNKKLTACNHLYCKKCLLRWIITRFKSHAQVPCPVCRKRISFRIQKIKYKDLFNFLEINFRVDREAIVKLYDVTLEGNDYFFYPK